MYYRSPQSWTCLHSIHLSKLSIRCLILLLTFPSFCQWRKCKLCHWLEGYYIIKNPSTVFDALTAMYLMSSIREMFVVVINDPSAWDVSSWRQMRWFREQKWESGLQPGTSKTICFIGDIIETMAPSTARMMEPWISSNYWLMLKREHMRTNSKLRGVGDEKMRPRRDQAHYTHWQTVILESSSEYLTSQAMEAGAKNLEMWYK